MGSSVASEVAEVLKALGVDVQAEVAPPDEGGTHDLRATINGRPLLIEAKTRATVTPRDVASLMATANADDGVARIVVADRVTSAAREMLRGADWGWLDRRGHLRLTGPGVLLEVEIPATAAPQESRDVLAGKVGLEVATWLLAHPVAAPGVRELARTLERSPSSVSEALSRLQDHGLVKPDATPVVPELFWEAADRWPTARQPLAAQPSPGDSSLTRRLEIGLDDIEQTSGWALTDTLAAAAYGAPLGVSSAAPPDFLVPSAEVERLARIILGAVSDRDRACTVRAAPVRWACRRRVDATVLGAGTHWPLVQPLFVALDLAVDPGRGREILEGWVPPEPWRRVW